MLPRSPVADAHMIYLLYKFEKYVNVLTNLRVHTIHLPARPAGNSNTPSHQEENHSPLNPCAVCEVRSYQ